RILRDKGIISAADYESALKDLSETMGTRAANSSTLAVGNWKTTLYGFAQADAMYHSTQSFSDFAGNLPVARPATYAGTHGPFQASVRNSRFGIRVQPPALGSLKTTGVLEFDLLGPTGTIGTTISEAAYFNNPVLRVRHAYLKLETPYVDVLFGQTWHL